MTQEEYEAWAAAFIEAAVQGFLGDADFYEAIEEQYRESEWDTGAVDKILDLIDEATCTIEVTWPPRVKGHPSQ